MLCGGQCVVCGGQCVVYGGQCEVCDGQCVVCGVWRMPGGTCAGNTAAAQAWAWTRWRAGAARRRRTAFAPRGSGPRCDTVAVQHHYFLYLYTLPATFKALDLPDIRPVQEQGR